MEPLRTLWLLLPRSVRRLPADIVAVITLVTLPLFSVLVSSPSTTVQIVLGLPLAFFLPGYAIVSALFPERQNSNIKRGDSLFSRFDGGIGVFERFALSLGLSLAVVPLFGLVLMYTRWEIQPLSATLALGGFTLVASGVAVLHRRRLPPDDRFRLPYERWYASLRERLPRRKFGVDDAVTVTLALSVLLAVVSVSYAVAIPRNTESYTEFYLLTEGEDGDLVASGYPTEYTRGKGEQLVVAVGNREGERTEYTVIAELQEVTIADGEVRVLDSQVVERLRITVDANETRRISHTVTPEMTGQHLRLQYRLYRGDEPLSGPNPRPDETLHLWVNVTAPVE